MTLRFLGEAEQNEVVDSLQGFGGLGVHCAAGAGQQAAGIDGCWCCRPKGLSELAAEVRTRTAAVGQPRWTVDDFTGHLTLARARKRVPGELIGRPFEAEFLVSELWLVSSQLHPDGARYTRLSHWPLKGSGVRGVLFKSPRREGRISRDRTAWRLSRPPFG